MADAGNKWYVLKAVSGKEAKVKEYIEAEMKHNDLLAANVSQVLIPVEKHATVRNGKRVVKEKVSLPGYVFVEAKLKGDVAHTLRFLPNVLGFLGGLDEPTPVPQAQVHRGRYYRGCKRKIELWRADKIGEDCDAGSCHSCSVSDFQWQPCPCSVSCL